jgi:hypothetical protein
MHNQLKSMSRAALLLLCTAALFASTTASTAFAGEFGSGGFAAGQLANPNGIGLNEESGDVYIADRENNRIAQFTAAGQFVRAWGWGVADGKTAAFQECTATCFAGLAGGGAGQLGHSGGGLAVDNSLGLAHGNVYVEDIANSRVDEFTSEGEFILAFGHEVNATTHGDVCLVDETCQAGTTGPADGEFEPLSPRSVAVDSSGLVYVGDRNRVQKFSAAGAFVEAVPLPGTGNIAGVTVDSVGDLYVLGTEVGGVHKFDPSGSELGEPRQASAVAYSTTIAVGPANELYAFESASEHINMYAPGGEQKLSVPENGASRFSAASPGMAFDSGSDSLYLAYPATVVVNTLPPVEMPFVLPGSETTSEVGPNSAILEAAVNAEGPGETTYHFEYGTTLTYGSSTPSEALSGGAFEDQHFKTRLEGLLAGVTYHFRIVVSGPHGTVTGSGETFTTLPPVLIDGEATSNVTATSANLIAELDPLGAATGYHFEYGPTSSYGTSVPVPDANAGSGISDMTEVATIEGLAPDTTYHYRVVAHNGNGAGLVEGADHQFTTQSATPAGLPDGRAWEMVSPPDKHGVLLESMSEEGSVIQAAASGSALAYIATAPITSSPAGSRSLTYSQVLSRRSAPGVWSTQDIATPHEAVTGYVAGNLSEYRLFSDELTAGLVEPVGGTPLPPLAPSSERTPYLREAGGAYVPLVTAQNVPEGVKFGGYLEAGLNVESVEALTGDSDMSDVVLSSPAQLTPDGVATPGVDSLYVDSRTEGGGEKPELVSVLPNSSPAAAEGAGARLGVEDKLERNAITTDGNRVVFETKTAENQVHLYVRDRGLKKTVRLDVPAEGIEPSSGEPQYQDANGDASLVFFTDSQRLTTDSTAAAGHSDLYVCEVHVEASALECGLKDVTVPVTGGEPADVLGSTLGTGENGNIVYFVANGALTVGSARGDCEGGVHHNATPPPLGQSCNLYRHDVAAGTTELVASLSNRDAGDWETVNSDLADMVSHVSANGRYLVFMSQRSLTGYDNKDARSGEPDEEVYLFDGATDELHCVSCNPTGARPTGVFDTPEFPGLLVDRPGIWWGDWLAGSIPGWTSVDKLHALYQPRVLFDSGRMFFDSPNALVPRDGNSQEDVYEYEPPGGEGQPADNSCTTVSSTYSEKSGGCVSLISSGTSSEESAFLDASENGNDVFFLTASKLVSTDVDNALDVYDAHVCSAEAPCAPAPPPPPPACSGDACQNPVAPPGETTPGSLTFHGPGNLTAPGVVRQKAKPLTRTQKLAKALRACHQVAGRARRAKCEKAARKKFGLTRKRTK